MTPEEEGRVSCLIVMILLAMIVITCWTMEAGLVELGRSLVEGAKWLLECYGNR